ncbi:hypothetical protein ACWD69_16195 [Micromonospora chokoriensis]
MMRSLGWSTDGVPTDEVRFVTPAGHAVYTDYGLYLPFVHYYVVGGELWPDDFWGFAARLDERAGRRSRGVRGVPRCGDRPVRRTVGPPDCDVRTEGRYLAVGRYSWRYAAWRRGDTILVVGPALDGYSYGQDEEAVVYIGESARDRPFPAAADFLGLLRK